MVSYELERRCKDSLAHLLNSGYVFRNILDGDWVLNGQSVRLAFNPGFVDKDTSIGSQT